LTGWDWIWAWFWDWFWDWFWAWLWWQSCSGLVWGGTDGGNESCSVMQQKIKRMNPVYPDQEQPDQDRLGAFLRLFYFWLTASIDLGIRTLF
jgi:hypothetical protein